MPIALVILISLFLIQRRGTAQVGALFGPVMIIWFGTLAALGINSILETPEILAAINPVHAIRFAVERPGLTLVLLGAVFLTLTGAEAMYADLGHFGRRPIRIGWFALVYPCLMLNYFGQGALVLRNPEAVGNPFYLLAPEPLLLPLIILATFATVIVSISRRGLFGWRRSLFGWMLQNSSSTASYFALPPNRVVELGTQVAI